jgi:predicted AlkP superfamily phosphohydrolase/phosphomutase
MRPCSGPVFVASLMAIVKICWAVGGLHAQAPAKAIVVGWDGAVSSFVLELLAERKLPHLARLIEGGTFAADVTAVFPSKTAPGFASLWSGAPPRVTGISGNRQPRTPAHQHTILDSQVSFLSAPMRAEPLWTTALRTGRKVTVAHVPLGRELSDGAVKLLGYDGYSGRDGAVSATSLALQPPTAWSNLPASAKTPLEFEFAIGASQFFGLLIDDQANGRDGYDTLLIAAARDGARTVATMKPGAPPFDPSLWRGPIEVKTTGGENATVYLRLFELSADGKKILLYHTRPVRQLIFPTELAESYSRAAGAFIGNGASFLYQEGALGPTLAAGGGGEAEARYLETIRMAQRQLEQTALWAMRQGPWDLLFLYTPYPDEAEHVLRGYADLAGHSDTKVRLGARRLLEETYKTCDDLLGLLMANKTSTTAIALVSDHGMEGINKLIAVNRVLERERLLVLSDQGLPDLTRTKAFYPAVNNGYVLINSTDRKGGIVMRRDRAAVIQRLRRALLEIRDDGKPVIAAVYDPERDGEAMGIGGDGGGDLYLDPLPGYDFDPRLGPGEIIIAREPYGTHGFNPVRRSMRTIMVFNGPGFASGKTVKNASILDFAPTLAKRMGLPMPRDATGHVLQEALTDH